MFLLRERGISTEVQTVIGLYGQWPNDFWGHFYTEVVRVLFFLVLSILFLQKTWMDRDMIWKVLAQVQGNGQKVILFILCVRVCLSVCLSVKTL